MCRNLFLLSHLILKKDVSPNNCVSRKSQVKSEMIVIAITEAPDI